MGFALSDMQLTSDAFDQGGAIPKKYTGEGEDVSYGFVHWVLYNIPGNVSSLAEGESGYTSGKSDFGKAGYGGPMPPNGHGTHYYFFWVLALDDDAQLEEGLTLWELLARIEPNLIGMNRLVGTYERD
ncbi:MAG: YbhB/YbcL family Raf kinase inhibitor-like protein [Gammaproteobacteria bacterium]